MAKNICIIGAGPAGLQAIKHVKDQGWQGTVFEQACNLGGVWRYTAEKGTAECDDLFPTPVYQDLVMNTPYQSMEFQDFPWASNTPIFPTRQHAWEYLRRYASHFKLDEFIKYHHQVVSVSPENEQDRDGTKWSVAVRSLAHTDNTITNHTFDAVIICSGREMVHKTPELKNMDAYRGTILTAAQYAQAHEFDGQRVLFCGAGGSALDLIFNTKTAKQIYLSAKSKTQNFMLPSNAKLVTTLESATSTGFILSDGTELKGIDAIVFCTGYKYSYPFLSPACGITVINDKKINQLYRHLVNIKFPGLYFPGIIKPTPAFYALRIQIQWIMQVLRGSITLPSEQNMIREGNAENLERSKHGIDTVKQAHVLFNEQWRYYKLLGDEGNFPVVDYVEKMFTVAYIRGFVDHGHFRKDSYKVDGDQCKIAVFEEPVPIDRLAATRLALDGLSLTGDPMRDLQQRRVSSH